MSRTASCVKEAERKRVHKESQVQYLVRFYSQEASQRPLCGRTSSSVLFRIQQTCHEPLGAGAACPHGGKHSKQHADPWDRWSEVAVCAHGAPTQSKS